MNPRLHRLLIGRRPPSDLNTALLERTADVTLERLLEPAEPSTSLPDRLAIGLRLGNERLAEVLRLVGRVPLPSLDPGVEPGALTLRVVRERRKLVPPEAALVGGGRVTPVGILADRK